MPKKYDITKKSDMRRLERDLKKTVQKAVDDAYKSALDDLVCPNCGRTFRAHVGHETCPLCGTEFDLKFANKR